MSKRVIWIAVGLAAAAAILAGVFTHRWVVGSDFGVDQHVGLRSIEMCQDITFDEQNPHARECESVSFSSLRGTAGAINGFSSFATAASLTFYTGLVTAGLLVVVVGLTAARRFPNLPIAPSTLAIVGCFALGVLMALCMMLSPWRNIGWGPGLSVTLSGAGATGGLVAAILLGRLRPPVSDDW